MAASTNIASPRPAFTAGDSLSRKGKEETLDSGSRGSAAESLPIMLERPVILSLSPLFSVREAIPCEAAPLSP